MNVTHQSNIESMPDLLRSDDLIAIGLYRNKDSVYLARKNGNSPDYIRIGHRILFPKSSVIQFISSRLQDGSKQRNR